jgi:DNA primase
MGKTYIETIKYMILADFKVIGIVERPDIIGAIFGQSEGLLGSELDIKELQQNGKIGRIEIEYTHPNGSTQGVFKLPCSVSMVETAIIAASIETVEKVGPCDSTFVIKEIQDTRGLKRKQIKNRAIDLLGRLMQDQIPDTKELMDEITDTFKTKEIISYGPDKLAAGPTLEASKDIVIVEGRADILNLLKYGFTNTVATGGARIPKSLASICKGKNVTLFLDGDHGGDIQQSQLFKVIDIDYVARAPDGKEVEELTQKEINQALRRKIKASYILSSKSKNNNTSNTSNNINNIKNNIDSNTNNINNINNSFSKKDGIIKKTKFSITNEHKINVKPNVDIKNKPVHFVKAKIDFKNIKENDSFNNMLSEIPNIERVDIIKSNNKDYNSDHNNDHNNDHNKNYNKNYNKNNIKSFSFSKNTNINNNPKKNNLESILEKKINLFLDKEKTKDDLKENVIDDNNNNKTNSTNIINSNENNNENCNLNNNSNNSKNSNNNFLNSFSDNKIKTKTKEKININFKSRVNSNLDSKNVKKDIKRFDNIKSSVSELNPNNIDQNVISKDSNKENVSEKTNVVELPKLDDNLKENFKKIVIEIKDKNRSRMLNEKLRRIANSKNKDLENKLKNFKNNKIFAIIHTSNLSENLLKYSIDKEVKFIIVKDSKIKSNNQINIITYKDLGL